MRRWFLPLLVAAATVFGLSTAGPAAAANAAPAGTAPIGDGYVFLVARHSGKCLAILSESLEVGAKLVQYSCAPYSPRIDPIGGSYWHFD